GRATSRARHLRRRRATLANRRSHRRPGPRLARRRTGARSPAPARYSRLRRQPSTRVLRRRKLLSLRAPSIAVLPLAPVPDPDRRERARFSYERQKGGRRSKADPWGFALPQGWGLEARCRQGADLKKRAHSDKRNERPDARIATNAMNAQTRA